MLIAKSDITLGYFASAETNFEYALHIDSTRAKGWYEYLSFLKMREIHNSFVKVKNKIEELNEEKQLHYTD